MPIDNGGGYAYGGRSTVYDRAYQARNPIRGTTYARTRSAADHLRREYAPYSITERMVGRLAPNLRPEWTSAFYRRGGSVVVDPSIKVPGVTPGYGRSTRILLQSPAVLGVAGVLGHEAVHATLAQPLGGLLAKMLQLAGAAYGLPSGRSIEMANAFNEAPAFQVGGPERSGYLRDIPPLLRPLYSGIVR